MGQYSKVETDGHLMIVTINRPEVYNACHPMANQEMVEAFDEFQANPDLWVAIITGAGDKAFCAGNDLKYHAEIQAKTGKRPVHPAKGFGGLANRFDLGGRTRRNRHAGRQIRHEQWLQLAFKYPESQQLSATRCQERRMVVAQ